VTEDFLFTTATDSRLKVFSLDSESLASETVLEIIATTLAVFEPQNDEEQVTLYKHFQVGANITYVVLGMINTISVYKFDMRFLSLTHMVSYFERNEYVGGTSS
jgi:hypothetical protein